MMLDASPDTDRDLQRRHLLETYPDQFTIVAFPCNQVRLPQHWQPGSALAWKALHAAVALHVPVQVQVLSR